jgi:glycosyltransferase involved in cell wall biosynthesis
MASHFDADLLDHGAARRLAGRWGRLLERVAGPNALLAWTCFRRRHSYRVVFTDGEPIGMPYAALTSFAKRRPRHVVIGHRLSAPKKVRLHRALRLQRRIDVVVVYASTQRAVALRLGYRPEQVVLSTFMVDTDFWRSDRVRRAAGERPRICAVGQELRDYPTLVEAVRGLDIDVAIAAVSPWSKRADTSAGLDVPANVSARGYDLFELRQLYADSDLVVVPLQETDFQAGITTILEAMAMERAIVCTRTTGQQDTIHDGVTGRYVPVGDAIALRNAIAELLDDPAEASRLARAARRWVTEHADIVGYAERLAALTRAT